MYSATGKHMRSAAWRISLWGALWFACGTASAFFGLHNLIARDLQVRDDAWLQGETESISDELLHIPHSAHYDQAVKERANLAGDEVPETSGVPKSTFFLEVEPGKQDTVWSGDIEQDVVAHEIAQVQLVPGTLFSIPIPGHTAPYRVAWRTLPDGSRIFLGLSQRGQRHKLEILNGWFCAWGSAIVLLGFAILFAITRGTLHHVRNITRTASRIGEANLAERLPVSKRHDEVAELAINLNRMLDRVERGVAQLHTVTSALAHDLRSPLTAIRARLEMAATGEQDAEAIAIAIEELDRLNEMLTQSLDVAEAQAGALSIDRRPVNLSALIEMMVELYTPSLQENGLDLRWVAEPDVHVSADESLLHRLVANLLENEMKHVPAGHRVCISVTTDARMAMLTFEDDGPGFPGDLPDTAFTRGVKGPDSRGHGLGLAFVQAVTQAHGGWVSARNLPSSGAQLRVALPLSSGSDASSVTPAMTSVSQ